MNIDEVDEIFDEHFFFIYCVKRIILFADLEKKIYWSDRICCIKLNIGFKSVNNFKQYNI